MSGRPFSRLFEFSLVRSFCLWSTPHWFLKGPVQTKLTRTKRPAVGSSSHVKVKKLKSFPKKERENHFTHLVTSLSLFSVTDSVHISGAKGKAAHSLAKFRLAVQSSSSLDSQETQERVVHSLIWTKQSASTSIIGSASIFPLLVFHLFKLFCSRSRSGVFRLKTWLERKLRLFWLPFDD